MCKFYCISKPIKKIEIVKSEDEVLLQVSLCDDYSLPVDFVNKRRPLSVGAVPLWSLRGLHGNPVSLHKSVAQVIYFQYATETTLSPSDH